MKTNMTNQQNNTLINLMLNGEFCSYHFDEDNEIDTWIYRNGKFQWVHIDRLGNEI